MSHCRRECPYCVESILISLFPCGNAPEALEEQMSWRETQKEDSNSRRHTELTSSETAVFGGVGHAFERAVFAWTVDDVGHQGKADQAP